MLKCLVSRSVRSSVWTTKAAARNGSHGVDSPLKLLIAPGAMRLLRAYAKLKDGVVRRSVVGLIEGLAHRPVEGAKKR